MNQFLSFFLLLGFLLCPTVAKETKIALWALDTKSREAVTGVDFEISWEDADKKRHTVKVRTNAKGEANPLVPMPSKLWIVAKKDGYLNSHGYPGGMEIDFLPANKNDIFEVEMNKGIHLSGSVIDHKTGRAIAGAKISPLVFTPPIFRGDRDRTETTDENGRFKIDAVDPDLGVSVRHDEYLSEITRYNNKVYKQDGKGGHMIELRLREGRHLSGIVTDKSNKLLSGVKLIAGNEHKTAVSMEDGTFVLKSVTDFENKGDVELIAEKKGYLDYRTELQTDQLDQRVTVVLERYPIVSGKVILPNGEPATQFEIDLSPGRSFQSWNTQSKSIRNILGAFHIQLPEKVDFIIRIRAKGHPMLLSHHKLDELGKPINLHLAKPVTVTIPFKLPEKSISTPNITLHRITGKVNELITGNSDGSSLPESIPVKREANKLILSLLDPNKDYVAYLHGMGITPRMLKFTTTQTPMTIPVVNLSGLGSISGRVYDPHHREKPWSLARGQIYLELPHNFEREKWAQPIHFKADANGRFKVSGIPTGKVTVNFPYWITADILGGLGKSVHVEENKETTTIIKPEAREYNNDDNNLLPSEQD